MARRYPNPRLVKVHWIYTPVELARLLRKHPNTIRNWIKDGLEPIDGSRHILIKGFAVRAYLESRRAANRKKCAPGTLYCFRCKEPRRPAGGMVEFVPDHGGGGTVTALCPDCETIMKQAVSEIRLTAFRLKGEVILQPAQQRLTSSE